MTGHEDVPLWVQTLDSMHFYEPQPVRVVRVVAGRQWRKQYVWALVGDAEHAQPFVLTRRTARRWRPPRPGHQAEALAWRAEVTAEAMADPYDPPPVGAIVCWLSSRPVGPRG